MVQEIIWVLNPNSIKILDTPNSSTNHYFTLLYTS
ncbi:hypothetical protein TpMuguga_01g00693 [Theileria parva strain Muguga]|uniref:Uncharacterized protein n=1 Tax=Theileria parva TaxID=5875 RepID=Q4N7X7_THEPA|nr:uncharacterized protein TpMuguga_01g00693 [Theileria parva strain Muguga]EAN33931.1 hypothetical protein TpMuguga_01g00693 [Theileria parva strain Muguga]